MSDTCETCGAHYMQTCSWWCGLSDERIKEIQGEYLMSNQVKAELREVIRSLHSGGDRRVNANRLTTLINKVG